MKHIYYKYFTYLLLLSLFLQTGCYTFSRGDLIGYEEVSNSQIFNNYSYNYKISSRPSFYKPQLVLNFYITPHYQYKAEENYNEVKTINNGANIIPRILYYGGAATAIGGGLMYLDSSASKSKKETGNLLIAGGLVSFLVGAFTWSDTTSKVTGDKIKGDIVTKYRDGNPTPLTNKNIDISINNNQKSFVTNLNGNVTIDLVKDFNLIKFENEEDIQLVFTLSKDEIEPSSSKYWSEKIKLISSDWTKKYFEIVAEEIQVYDSPGSSGKKLGVGKKTEKYEVLDTSSSSWTKVNFNGINGWISPYAGKYTWLAN